MKAFASSIALIVSLVGLALSQWPLPPDVKLSSANIIMTSIDLVGTNPNKPLTAVMNTYNGSFYYKPAAANQQDTLTMWSLTDVNTGESVRQWFAFNATAMNYKIWSLPTGGDCSYQGENPIICDVWKTLSYYSYWNSCSMSQKVNGFENHYTIERTVTVSGFTASAIYTVVMQSGRFGKSTSLIRYVDTIFDPPP